MNQTEINTKQRLKSQSVDFYPATGQIKKKECNFIFMNYVIHLHGIMMQMCGLLQVMMSQDWYWNPVRLMH